MCHRTVKSCKGVYRASEWRGGQLRNSTIHGDLGPETGDLARGEVVHARVVSVVHVVVDG